MFDHKIPSIGYLGWRWCQPCQSLALITPSQSSKHHRNILMSETLQISIQERDLRFKTVPNMGMISGYNIQVYTYISDSIQICHLLSMFGRTTWPSKKLDAFGNLFLSQKNASNLYPQKIFPGKSTLYVQYPTYFKGKSTFLVPSFGFSFRFISGFQDVTLLVLKF